MKTCNDDGSCRSEYSCVFPRQINMNGELELGLPEDEQVARIVDLEGNPLETRICVALNPSPLGVEPFELDGGL